MSNRDDLQGDGCVGMIGAIILIVVTLIYFGSLWAQA